MRNPVFWLALIIASAIAASLYFWKQKTDREAIVERLPPAQEEVAQTPPPASSEPEVVHPLLQAQRPPTAEAKPLPSLNESDDAIRASLAEALGKQPVGDLIVSKDIARRIVTTIDNLPRKKVGTRLLPVKPPGGQIVANGDADIASLSSANYARYAPYVKLAQRVDAKQLVAVYVHYYPLLQQAYQELGYPKKYFNDRVVLAIDDLLATPNVDEPVRLVRPKVLYEFADADLEDLSAGQKALIRMGPENAASIKAKLREIRREVVAEVPAPKR